MKNNLLTFCIAVALCACSRSTDATREHFARGLQDYLAQHGDLCLGKSAWPIDVTPREFALGARNAVQMPVLEKLGLVGASDATVEIGGDDGARAQSVKRYQLTDAGRKYFLAQRSPAGDFCAAKLSLDRIVGWELSKDAEHPQAVVRYTYRVAAAPWIADPAARRVFPMVDRVVQGAGTAELTQTFELTASGWVARDVL